MGLIKSKCCFPCDYTKDASIDVVQRITSGASSSSETRQLQRDQRSPYDCTIIGCASANVRHKQIHSTRAADASIDVVQRITSGASSSSETRQLQHDQRSPYDCASGNVQHKQIHSTRAADASIDVVQKITSGANSSSETRRSQRDQRSPYYCASANVRHQQIHSSRAAGATVAGGVNSLIPKTWSTSGSKPNAVQLYSDDREYHLAVAHLVVTKHDVTVQRVHRNEHTLMYANFLLCIEETKRLSGSASICILLHDTAADNVLPILGNNLDWRRSRRVKFGKGVSFSTSADYAMKYSNLANGADRAMLVTEVVIGRAMNTNYSTAFPPEGFDTTISKNGKVIVKYKDDEFYIKYVIFYTLNKRHYTINNQRKPNFYKKRSIHRC